MRKSILKSIYLAESLMKRTIPRKAMIIRNHRYIIGEGNPYIYNAYAPIAVKRINQLNGSKMVAYQIRRDLRIKMTYSSPKRATYSSCNFFACQVSKLERILISRAKVKVKYYSTTTVTCFVHISLFLEFFT